MRRFFYGALIGGVAMYLLDPENGRERRMRLSTWIRQNRGTFTEAADAAGRRAQKLKPVAAKAARTAADTAQSATSKFRREGYSEEEVGPSGAPREKGWEPPG
jgi:gas vesicle protein